MRVFWSNGGLHLEPEGDQERVALLALAGNITVGVPSETVIPGGTCELGSEDFYERLIGNHESGPSGLPGKPSDKKHVVSIQRPRNRQPIS